MLHLAGRRRLDVHGQHPQPVRNQFGSVPGRHAARLLPVHHDAIPGQNPSGRRLAPQLPHLLPAAGRLERPQGTKSLFPKDSPGSRESFSK